MVVLLSLSNFFESYSAQKVLVTGGAGFVGSHLCKKLLGLGYEVIALDNLYTGCKRNIYNLLTDEKFSFVEHNIIDPIDIEVGYIFNLACPASPPQYQKDPIFTTKTSIIGSINMLELARRYSAPILQASTSEIYGNPEQHPQQEAYRGCVNPIGPRACYDEGKRCAESLFFDYQRTYGVTIKIVRIFNTYGPNMDPYDGRVVSNFIRQALADEPLTIYGDGTQTRSFCYVDDLVDGIIAMMFDSPAHFTGPVNLGNPIEYNLLDLAQKVIALTQSNSPIVFKSLPEDDPRRRRPNISLAKETFGWEPKVPLDAGLHLTIDYFKNFTVLVDL